MLGLRVSDATAGYRAYHRRLLSQHRPRPGARRRLRVPGRDDLPEPAGRRPDRRGADRVPRPHPRPLQDVEPHRRRGPAPRHPLGHPRPHRRPPPLLRGPAPRDTEGMPIAEFTVAGALVESATGSGLLLVCNRRRNGLTDWSTPGGVIDATDPTLLDGLTREVAEETGLVVTAWEGPLYEVRATAVEHGVVAAVRSAPRARLRRRSRRRRPRRHRDRRRVRAPRRVRRDPRVVRALGRRADHRLADPPLGPESTRASTSTR